MKLKHVLIFFVKVMILFHQHITSEFIIIIHFRVLYTLAHCIEINEVVHKRIIVGRCNEQKGHTPIVNRMKVMNIDDRIEHL